MKDEQMKDEEMKDEQMAQDFFLKVWSLQGRRGPARAWNCNMANLGKLPSSHLAPSEVADILEIRFEIDGRWPCTCHRPRRDGGPPDHSDPHQCDDHHRRPELRLKRKPGECLNSRKWWSRRRDQRLWEEKIQWERKEKEDEDWRRGFYTQKGGFRSFGNMGTITPTVQISVLSSKLKVWYFTSLSDDRCTLSIYYWLRLSTIHYNKLNSSFTIQFKLLPVDFHLNFLKHWPCQAPNIKFTQALFKDPH